MMTKFRKRLQGSAGFTLVELIVVIAVLGILAGIAIPRITGISDDAEISAAKSDLRNIQSGFEMYRAAGNTINSSTTMGVITPYISLDTTGYTLTPSDTEPVYTVTTSAGGKTITLTPGGISE